MLLVTLTSPHRDDLWTARTKGRNYSRACVQYWSLIFVLSQFICYLLPRTVNKRLISLCCCSDLSNSKHSPSIPLSSQNWITVSIEVILSISIIMSLSLLSMFTSLAYYNLLHQWLIMTWFGRFLVRVKLLNLTILPPTTEVSPAFSQIFNSLYSFRVI